MINLIWSGFFIMLVLSGCGWNGTPTRSNDFTPLTSIEISADYSNIAVGTSTRLKVTGNFSGLFTRDVTDQVTWSSDNLNVAAFTMAGLPNRVKGVGTGSATVTATVGNISATCPITVSAVTFSTVTITPAAPSVAVGLSKQFTATGLFPDGTTQDITYDVAWASSSPDFATVSIDPASRGLVQAIAVGTSDITATFGAVSATSLITVTEPVLESITLSPNNPTLLTLSTRRLVATGTYSDGSTPDLSSQVTWNSSDTTITTIASDGTATALKPGSATISATLGSVSATTNLKATGGYLTGISVSPAAVTLVKDTAGRISATGTFSNGSTRDITGAVTWTPIDTSLATVTLAGGSLAWLNPLAVTSTTIKATYGALSSAAATLTVIAPQLQSIALSTTSLELIAGTSSPLSVIATYSDDTTQDVTHLSDWTSDDTTKATVAAGGLGTERVTGVAAGLPLPKISATYGGETVLTAATVTVRSPTLQKLTISGASTVAVGAHTPYTATATYSDGTIVDVTSEATAAWAVDSANIAIPADSINQPGQILGVDSGVVTLTVSFGGRTQTAKITVTGP
ncbi:MAG: Ig-like domain-containing protein [Desulfuromonadaceae bacterium]|nr:Ig-like domain-containing protein [Desulfuromonadaceae bacterium]